MNGTKIIGRIVLLAFTVLLAVPARAEGLIVEKVKTYPVTGTSGIELYRSIGERGPKIGPARAIAQTTFDLKWSRNYQPEGDGCRLVSARPSLIITYTLPEPKEKLPAAAARRWETFIAGIRSHEKVHGDMIKEMVATIERTTIGMSVAGDPACKLIRQEILKPLSEASLAQRQRSRDFDRTEFGDGGNLRGLILGLVTE